MASLFKSTLNTRALLPDCLRFIRSDVPAQLSEQETEWLIERNVTTVVDLRTEEERQRKGCPLASDPRFQYHCMPVTGGNAVPSSIDAVSESYINMVDEQMDAIIDLIWNAQSNVLYFCGAGKDRTGVVSAILLRKLGMDHDYIVADYMKSKENLQSALENYAKQNPEIQIDVITPQEAYIKEFLNWMETD